MRTIYIKDSNIRRKEFALKTRIFKDKNIKIVIKEPCFPEGLDHINNIEKSQKNFFKYYSNVKIAKTWIEDNILYSEFIEGISLSDLYMNAINNNDYHKLIELINYHFKLLLGNNNSCSFSKSEKFDSLFGKSYFIRNTASLIFTFFETDPANIIFKNNDLNDPYFIDYEWFYDFPIPVSLLGFRLIQQLSLISGFNNFISLREGLKIINCDFSMNDGTVLLNNFFTNIYVNKLINYSSLNNNYLKEITFYSDFTINIRKRTCTLYFDTGNGFSENEKKEFFYFDNMVEITCQVPVNVKSIRLDPVENFGCFVNNLEILSYDGIVDYEHLNGFSDKNGYLLFTNSDPQILLGNIKHWVNINYHIQIFTDFSYYKIFDGYIKKFPRKSKILRIFYFLVKKYFKNIINKK